VPLHDDLKIILSEGIVRINTLDMCALTFAGKVGFFTKIKVFVETIAATLTMPMETQKGF
jgi:hypothetical protein